MFMRPRRTRTNPLLRIACLKILEFIFVTPFQIMRYIFKQRHTVEDNEVEYDEEVNYTLYDPDPLATCPEFMQLINIDDDTVIGIEDIIWCPDETALLRVLTEKEVSKPFKKKVYRFKQDRFIKLGSDKIYIK